ncbi:MAG: hypothetical protein ABGW81_10330 [Paracoccaceae bacterium]
MTRPRFRELYKSITGKAVEVEAINFSKLAEKVRDQILHGKDVSGGAEFKPFDNIKGFKGAAKTLDKSTSRWVLTGIGTIWTKSRATPDLPPGGRFTPT